MDTTQLVAYVIMPLSILVLSTIVGIIINLLRSKDEAQEKSIDLLLVKHDTLVKDFQAHKELLAGQYHDKHELDKRFDRLENSFKDGLDKVESSIKKLGDLLMSHIGRAK